MPRAKPKTKRARKAQPKIRAVAGVLVANPEGRPTLYRPEYAQLLYQHLANGSSYETFVTKIEPNPSTGMFVNIDTLYNWESLYPEFSEAKARGNQARIDMYESAARNISIGLVPPPPTDANGKPLGMMTRGNAAMTMFMLANLAPEKYRRPAAREDNDPSGSGADPGNSSREPIINFNYERLPEPPKKVGGTEE